MSRSVLALAAAALLGAIVAVPATGAVPEATEDAIVRDAATFARQQLTSAVATTSTSRYPIYTGSSGAWTTSSASTWTSGFFPGSLWLAYQGTDDSTWMTQADRWQRSLESQKYNTSTHDVGFMIFNSFGNAYRLTGNDAYRQVVLTAAGSLASRYNAVVGCLRSWNSSSDFQVIIDNMMNLELLFWAAKHGGNPAWYDMAVSHALKTIEHHIRPDGSTYQLVNFDQATGAVRSKAAVQGVSVDTTWSRGQAWGIYGFTMTFRETADPRFLDAARRLADYYLDHVPADMVPYWDFQAPNVPNEPRDTSAAAIAASGLVELAQLETDPARAARYRDAATATITSLASSGYLTRGTGNAAVLLHGTYTKPGNIYDTGLIWGDYYFLESLLRYRWITPSTPTLPVVAVSASGDDGNAAANAIDGNLTTRWAANGDGQWLQLDLGADQDVQKVGIAFYLGDQRASELEIQTSRDGVSWSTALRTLASGRTLRPETFDFADRPARFVRIVGLGNVLDALNGITEVAVYGAALPPPEDDVTPPAAPTGVAAVAGDGSATLDWADNGEADLGGYAVYRRNADGSWPATPLALPAASAFTDTGLVNGVEVAYRVTARDLSGNESAPSAVVVATPGRLPVTKTYQPAAYTVYAGAVHRNRGALSRLFSDDGSRVEISSRSSEGVQAAEIRVSTTVAADELATLASLRIVTNGSASSSSAALTVSVYDWRTGSWVVLDGPRTGVTSDRTVNVVPPGAPADYVSPAGEVVVSLRGTRSRSFTLRTDMVGITIQY